MIKIKDERISKRIAIGDFFERNYFEIFTISIVTVIIIFAIVVIGSWIEKCPNCNKLHFTSGFTPDRYCTECGYDFYNVCNCGERNDKGANYCKKCGDKLSHDE